MLNRQVVCLHMVTSSNLGTRCDKLLLEHKFLRKSLSQSHACRDSNNRRCAIGSYGTMRKIEARQASDNRCFNYSEC